jgi:hypothetical protein
MGATTLCLWKLLITHPLASKELQLRSKAAGNTDALLVGLQTAGYPLIPQVMGIRGKHSYWGIQQIPCFSAMKTFFALISQSSNCLHSFFFWHTEGGMRPEMFTNTGCFEASC